MAIQSGAADNTSAQNSAAQPAGIKERLDFNEDFKLDWHDPDEATDGYQLKWIGKDYARLQSGTAPRTVIIPDSEHNAQPANTDSGNVFLTGDNLEVLKHLQNAYRNSIDMIYIDPPYNTGKEFTYNDKFDFSDVKLKDMLGLTDTEIKRLHTINGRSSHSAWLTFMYPRLKLARTLLKDVGIIFISIDDNEHANLKLLCDEIFGEGNFIAQLTVENNPKGRKNNIFIAESCEYCMIYAKNIHAIYGHLPESIKKYFLGITRSELDTRPQLQDKYGKFQQSKRQISGRNKSNTLCKNTNDQRCFTIYYFEGDDKEKEDMIFLDEYDRAQDKWIESEKGKALREKGYIRYECTNNQTDTPSIPLYTKETLRKMLEEHRLYFKTDGTIYEKERDNCQQLTSFLANKRFGLDLMTESATTKMETLFGIKDIFQNAKALDYIKVLISQIPVADCTILDFFAGSGTTAHAVMQLNAEDGGKRKWILCNIDEPPKEDSGAHIAGYKTIDEIAIERIKRAAAQIGDTSGFKRYFVKEPAAQTLDKITEFDPAQNMLIPDDMVAAMGGEAVILHTWLVADGYKLDYKPEERDIAGYTAYYCGNSMLYIINQGWGKEQTKELLNRIGTHTLNVNTIICYGYSFTLESIRELEINIKQSLNNQIQIETRY